MASTFIFILHKLFLAFEYCSNGTGGALSLHWEMVSVRSFTARISKWLQFSVHDSSLYVHGHQGNGNGNIFPHSPQHFNVLFAQRGGVLKNAFHSPHLDSDLHLAHCIHLISLQTHLKINKIFNIALRFIVRIEHGWTYVYKSCKYLCFFSVAFNIIFIPFSNCKCFHQAVLLQCKLSVNIKWGLFSGIRY